LRVALRFTGEIKEVSDVAAELINSKRETKQVSLMDLVEKVESDSQTDSAYQFNVQIPFSGLKEFLEQQDFSFEALRITAETIDKNKYKSHELALHNWWNIMKLDSGKYN